MQVPIQGQVLSTLDAQHLIPKKCFVCCLKQPPVLGYLYVTLSDLYISKMYVALSNLLSFMLFVLFLSKLCRLLVGNPTVIPFGNHCSFHL